MTSKSKLVTFLTAGVLGLSAAAHARTAVAPDPNLAPTDGEQSQILTAGVEGAQLAEAPDSNLSPSTIAVEAAIPATLADAPQLAAAPDANLGTSTTNAEANIERMVAERGSTAGGSAQAAAQ